MNLDLRGSYTAISEIILFSSFSLPSCLMLWVPLFLLYHDIWHFYLVIYPHAHLDLASDPTYIPVVSWLDEVRSRSDWRTGAEFHQYLLKGRQLFPVALTLGQLVWIYNPWFELSRVECFQNAAPLLSCFVCSFFKAWCHPNSFAFVSYLILLPGDLEDLKKKKNLWNLRVLQEYV